MSDNSFTVWLDKIAGAWVVVTTFVACHIKDFGVFNVANYLVNSLGIENRTTFGHSAHPETRVFDKTIQISLRQACWASHYKEAVN